MSKVSIKKNVKPKTIKQKQRQTQKTNVTVNIGSTSKKRGRVTRKSQLQKKPTQQPISQPSITSYNQPIFKQPSSLPVSSLASSILASQPITKVIEEVKNESALQKALIDQNTDVAGPSTKINDLERVRAERIKKFEQPKTPIIKPDPVRSALFSQILGDQGDDTEEIASLTSSAFRPIQPISRFLPSSLSNFQAPSILSSSSGSQSYTPSSLSDYSRPSSTFSNINFIEDEPVYGGVEESKNSEPPEESPLQQQEPPPTILEQPEPEPTILDTTDYSDVGSVIDDMLSSGPSSINEEDKTVNPLNLQPIKTPEPSILQQEPTKSSLTQALKGPAEEPPQQATLIPFAEIAGRKEAEELFKQLRTEGKIGKKVTLDKPSDTTASGKVKKSEQDFTYEINKVTGYETWKPKENPSGRKKKIVEAEVKPQGYELPPGATSILDLYE
jgi:hypothetical protein